jgi:hypothetical protein
MRLPHLTSLWPHLFTPFTQKMSEVLYIKHLEIDAQGCAWPCRLALRFQLPGPGRFRIRRAVDRLADCLDFFLVFGPSQGGSGNAHLPRLGIDLLHQHRAVLEQVPQELPRLIEGRIANRATTSFPSVDTSAD